MSRAGWLAVSSLVVVGVAAFLIAVASADFQISAAAEFARAAYCSAPGNQNEDGSEIPPGTFLDLIVGEPDRNPRLVGATPANFIEGTGLTCSNPPPGFVPDGLATSAQNVTSGIYPYYRPGS
jgi:hypothetical protein